MAIHGPCVLFPRSCDDLFVGRCPSLSQPELGPPPLFIAPKRNSNMSQVMLEPKKIPDPCLAKKVIRICPFSWAIVPPVSPAGLPQPPANIRRVRMFLRPFRLSQRGALAIRKPASQRSQNAANSRVRSILQPGELSIGRVPSAAECCRKCFFSSKCSSCTCMCL